MHCLDLLKPKGYDTENIRIDLGKLRRDDTIGSRSVHAFPSQTAEMPTHASGDTTVRGLGSGLWNSHPKNYGKGGRSCRVTKNQHALIRKYGINMCRQAFRERAGEIGFVKYHRPPQLGTAGTDFREGDSV